LAASITLVYITCKSHEPSLQLVLDF